MSDSDTTHGTELERTECWRCGYQRLTYESCPECGGSCKPLTRAKQDPDGERTLLHSNGGSD